MSENNNSKNITQETNPRVVANLPIDESYKGILRVGNNIDLQNNTPDKFLDQTYYVSSSNYYWEGNGINSIHSFIDAENGGNGSRRLCNRRSCRR